MMKNRDWTWLVRYSIVIVIALVLSTAFANMDLFSQTWVVRNKLSAARLVQFIGYAAALATFWIAGQQFSRAFNDLQGRWAFLRDLVLPLITLITVAAAHSVSLLLLSPFLEGDLRSIYNWLFILAILAAAVWLLMTALKQSNAVTDAISNNEKTLCKSCGGVNTSGAKYCQYCAQGLN